MPELTITIDDIRKAGHCARMRGWFQSQGLYEEFRAMVKGEGCPVSKLLATGDPRVAQVIRCKLERSHNG